MTDAVPMQRGAAADNAAVFDQHIVVVGGQLEDVVVGRFVGMLQMVMMMVMVIL